MIVEGYTGYRVDIGYRGYRVVIDYRGCHQLGFVVVFLDVIGFLVGLSRFSNRILRALTWESVFMLPQYKCRKS